MTQEFYFGKAAWVGAHGRTPETFSVLRGHFTVSAPRSVRLNVLGLGFFRCFINGSCVNPDTFLPLSSEYEGSADPKDEVFSGHRIYVPSFDVTPFVRTGDNVVSIEFGGGWYTHRSRTFGLPKAIYRLSVEESDGTVEFVSDRSCRIGKSTVEQYDFTKHEHRSFLGKEDPHAPSTDDGAWESAIETEPLVTEYCTTACPTDALIATLSPKRVGTGKNGGTVYDIGRNTSGYPVLRLLGAAGETVRVLFSEELSEDGAIDPTHAHRQEFSVVCDGTERTAEPMFTWFGFRYFELIGNAEPLSVKVIHAKVTTASTFDSDNETLNWIYRTFLDTMLSNMHTGHPSDCPHIERCGYTGDGQLTCHAVLSVLDARALYEKWLRDIADSQDSVSGHVQYTAPYIRSGGGPGGWGCAIVEVPYQLYRHYGDKAILSEYYENMRRYIDYLEAHSEFGLVTSDKAGEWCLGDWCGPNILYPEKRVTSHSQQVLIPAPMVNTYFMVKSLRTMCEIASIIGRDEDIPAYREKAEQRKNAIRAAYFNTFDGNFVMNVQGANAFALDLGLGNAKTYPNTLTYYRAVGHYDTGIFATDVLTRILFERGDAELAFELLTNDGPQGFEHWRRNGATTLHEYWDSTRSRSHNHPMFGSPVAYFFEYLLGIKQRDGTAGYTDLVISPAMIRSLNRISGSMDTVNGRVAVSYEKSDTSVRLRITVPPKARAVLCLGEREYPLSSGENEIISDLQQ